MKFYIASGFENSKSVKTVASVLKAHGLQQTYDWTEYEYVTLLNDDTLIAQIGESELQGVKDADVVIVLLPGGRGTHVELGIANAMNKKVFLWADSNQQLLQNGGACPFYWNSNVERIIGDRSILIEKIFRYEEKLRFGH